MLAPPRFLNCPAGAAAATASSPPPILPGSLASELRLSPEPFAALCAASHGAVLERELAADASLILMPRSGSETGTRDSALPALHRQAIRRDGLPFKLFETPQACTCPTTPCPAPMRRCRPWSAGSSPRLSNGAAWQRTAPIRWSGWRAPVMRLPAV
jgi:hypothetical protein